MIKEQVPRTMAPKENRTDLIVKIEEWIASDNNTLKIKCASSEEARRVWQSCYQYRKIHKLDYTIFKKTIEVYLVKA